MGGLIVLVICVLVAIPLMSIIALVRAGAAKSDILRLEEKLEAQSRMLEGLERRLRKHESAVAAGPSGAAAQTEAPKAPATQESEPAGRAAQTEEVVADVQAGDPQTDDPQTNDPLGDAPKEDAPQIAAARAETGDAVQVFDVWSSTRRAGAPSASAATGSGSGGPDGPAGPSGPSDPYGPAEPAGPTWSDRAMEWLAANWFLAAAAASLALSGLFLIQYSAQHGLLSPSMRILGALGLGLALIGGGEVIRRRMGAGAQDATGSAADYLPSTFAGAGLFTLFGAVVAARHMYDLIGAPQAFAGLIATALLAVLLGWFYGPFLAAVGIVAAALVPFMVGGGTGAEPLLFAYYAVLALAALGVDSLRRWVWVSWTGVAACLGASALLWAGWSSLSSKAQAVDVSLWWLAALMVIAAGAAIIPKRRLMPIFGGALARDPQAWLLGAAASAASFGTVAVRVAAVDLGLYWMAVAAQVLIALGLLVWLRRSEGLAWLAALPMAGFALAALTYPEGALRYEALAAGQGEAIAREAAGAAQLGLPYPAALLLVAAFYTALAFWRMQRAAAQARPVIRAPRRDIEAAPEGTMLHDVIDRLARRARSAVAGMEGAMVWALVAAGFAPVIAGLVELRWHPAEVMGRAIWALSVMALAALMVLLCERAMRGGRQIAAGQDTQAAAQAPHQTHARAALFAVAAGSMMSLALTVMLSDLALSVALAVMVALAALTDRKFNLPALAVFGQIGALIVGVRLTLEAAGAGVIITSPQVPLIELWLWAGVSMGLLWAGWQMFGAAQSRAERSGARITIESVLWVVSGVLIIESIGRIWGDVLPRHAQSGLGAAVLFCLMGGQLWRLQSGGAIMQMVRQLLAGTFGVFGALAYLGVATGENPLLNPRAALKGPFILDSALLALLLPAAILAVIVWRMAHLPLRARQAGAAVSAAGAAIYAWTEFRRLWHGQNVALTGGFEQSEIYAYTVLMLIAAAGMFYAAFARRSVMLRKAATGIVAVTIAKVFFLDAGGLDGLWRVASFLGLGLALGALAWLTRLMSAQWERGADAGDDDGKERAAEQGDDAGDLPDPPKA